MTKEEYNKACIDASREMIEDISNILLSSNGKDIFYKNATISDTDDTDLPFAANNKELNISFNITNPDTNEVLAKLEAAATNYYKKRDDAYRLFESGASK